MALRVCYICQKNVYNIDQLIFTLQRQHALDTIIELFCLSENEMRNFQICLQKNPS